jgi:iron complex transport system ATP-binding protein
VVVLHDLGLAARWADRIMVLQQGRVHAAGSPEQTLTSAMLEQVYRVQARIEHCSKGRIQIVVDGSVA